MSDRPIPKPGADEPLDLEKELHRAERGVTLERRLEDVLSASQKTLDLIEQDRRDGLPVDEALTEDIIDRMQRIRSRWRTNQP